MSAVFHDLQDRDNPINGHRIDSFAAMKGYLDSWRTRAPFLFELRHSNGFMMTVGFAATQGTAQHSRASGQPPYLMAMTEGAEAEAEFVEFLAGGTPTPIPCRYCLPIEILHEILAPFIQDGSLSQAVNWEEI